jgi:hypothetical protein
LGYIGTWFVFVSVDECELIWVRLFWNDGCSGNERAEAVAMQTEGADPQYICMRTKHMSARRPHTNETTSIAC